MSERGVFHHRERARQLVAFEHLRWGTVTPTDFDMFVDFGGKAFVLAELKHRDAPLLRGQELAFERLVDACDRGGVPTLGLVASHDVDIGDVIAAHATVTRWRWKRRWHAESRGFSLAQAVERFLIRVKRGVA